MILNALEGRPLPIYGDGKNIRDWLHVEDHGEAVWRILNNGKRGETYTIGGESERQNTEVVETICSMLEELYPLKKNAAVQSSRNDIGRYADLVTFVPDRPGHDRRYAINCDKIKKELKWKQRFGFEEGLRQTISWYLANTAWVNTIRSGEYTKWIDKNYSARPS